MVLVLSVTSYQSLPIIFPHLWGGKSKISNLFLLQSSFNPTGWATLSKSFPLNPTLYTERAQCDTSLKTLPDLEFPALACSEDSGHLSHFSHQLAPWLTIEHTSSLLALLFWPECSPRIRIPKSLAQWMDGWMVHEKAEGWMGWWLTD